MPEVVVLAVQARTIPHVVDFVALLQKSLKDNKRTPAGSSDKVPVKKSTTRKAAKKATLKSFGTSGNTWSRALSTKVSILTMWK